MATTLTSSPASTRSLPDPFDRPAKRLWHNSAPKAVSANGRPGEPDDETWKAWAAHLASRTEPVALGDLLSGKACPLTWNLPDGTDASDTAAFLSALARLQKKKRPSDPPWQEQLEPWLAEAAETAPRAAYALECLAVAHALPRLAACISPELWWELLAHLTHAATEPRGVTLSADPLTVQLIRGELPLTLSYLFPEIRPCRDLKTPAHQELSAGLVELLDGEGMPRCDYLHLLRPLLACWTRCRAIGEQTKKNCWNTDADDEYQWLITQALRLSRADGSQMFSGGSAGAYCVDLFKSALELGGDESDQAAAGEALPGRGKDGKKYANYEQPEPAANSEWSGIAVLRPDWSPAGARLAVQYGGNQVQLELECGREVVLGGTWKLDVEVDGRRLEPTDDWEEVCWSSDDDVDYLEIEISLDDDVRVQRQFLMAREDGFLYVADMVLADARRKIDYRSQLPLSPGIAWEPADETREGYLGGVKRRALVMPLALPEWRSDPRYGALTADGGTLQLRQDATGQNLCCPLFFDLNPRRLTRQRTWRQLTVAESLKAEPRDAAVGYRVQSSHDQWMIYRSLAELGSRTLLGQHINSEFVIGRFDADGELEELLEIE